MRIIKTIILTTLVLSTGCATQKSWLNVDGSTANQESLSIAKDECQYGAIKKKSHVLTLNSSKELKIRRPRLDENEDEYNEFVHQYKKQHMHNKSMGHAHISRLTKIANTCMKTKGFKKE